MRTRLRRLLIPIAVVAALAGLTALPAAALQEIAVTNFAFTPSSPTVSRGETVAWDVTEGTHTATDSTRMALYNSGQLNVLSDDFTYKFNAAGRYDFRCINHASMTGVIRVPVTVSPQEGSTGQTYTVTWASVNAPAGYKYDVQMRGPSNETWQSFRPGTTNRRTSFTPNQGAGRYDFRARLREAGVGASRWSPTASAFVGSD